MQKITLLCLGSLKTSWIQEGCSDYAKRIGHDAQFEVVELPASKEKDPHRQADDESNRLLGAIEKMNGLVWALDETGMHYTSADFATQLGTVRDRGDTLTFVLGGAYGLSDAVRTKADRIVALSAMTLPHELCRLLFLEQIYRSLQIQKGTGYHH